MDLLADICQDVNYAKGILEDAAAKMAELPSPGDDWRALHALMDSIEAAIKALEIPDEIAQALEVEEEMTDRVDSTRY